MSDVLRGLFDVRQSTDVATQRHALFELAQIGIVQNLAQLRLARQDDLQFLGGVGLEITEQANLFQNARRQTVRFVDDQDRAQATAVTRIENLAQLQQQIGLGFPILNIEQRRQMLVELSYRQTRIEDVSDQNRTVQTLHHPAKNGRLAGADFASDCDQAFAAFDAVVKIGHHFGVRRREIDVARIG